MLRSIILFLVITHYSEQPGLYWKMSLTEEGVRKRESFSDKACWKERGLCHTEQTLWTFSRCKREWCTKWANDLTTDLEQTYSNVKSQLWGYFGIYLYHLNLLSLFWCEEYMTVCSILTCSPATDSNIISNIHTYIYNYYNSSVLAEGDRLYILSFYKFVRIINYHCFPSSSS